MQGLEKLEDLDQLEDQARPTTPDYPLQRTDLTGDLEQLEDPYRPMTAEEEQIMRMRTEYTGLRCTIYLPLCNAYNMNVFRNRSRCPLWALLI